MRKATVALLLTLVAPGCAAGPRIAASAGPSAEDATRRLPEVPEAEGASVLRGSFPEAVRKCAEGLTQASVMSSIRGSFTAPGRDQTMYYVVVLGCDEPPSAKRDVLVTYEDGREVRREAGYQPVRAVDPDGDGQDEWVERRTRCDDTCATTLSVRGL